MSRTRRAADGAPAGDPAGRASPTVPMTRRRLADRMAAEDRRARGRRLSGGDEGDEAALIGDVKRVEAEELAGRARHPRAPALCVSSMSMERPAVSAISTSALASPPRVRSRRQWTAMPASISASTGSTSGAQSLSIADSKPSPSRAAITAMPWRPMSPLTMTASPGRTLCGSIGCSRHDPADAGGVDEELVGLAAIDDLGVAGDDAATPAAAAAVAHRGDDAARASPAEAPPRG